LNTTIAQLNTTIAWLNTTIARLNTTIAQLNTTIARLNTTIARLNTGGMSREVKQILNTCRMPVLEEILEMLFEHSSKFKAFYFCICFDFQDPPKS